MSSEQLDDKPRGFVQKPGRYRSGVIEPLPISIDETGEEEKSAVIEPLPSSKDETTEEEKSAFIEPLPSSKDETGEEEKLPLAPAKEHDEETDKKLTTVEGKH